MPKVLITGATGYVASWCVHEALEAGYEVVGTVRDQTAKKCQFLRDAIEGKPGKLSSKATTKLRLVDADLLAGEEAWDTIMSEGFDAVMHVASPYVTAKVTDPDTLIKPAVQGTTSILKAAIKHGVKRAVVTSSIAAVSDPNVEGKTYGPDDWSNPEVQGPYMKSKTLAEKAAWETVEGTSLQLCTMIPTGIRGPSLYSDKDMMTSYESGAFICNVLEGKYKFTWMCQGVIDVRDLARGHVLGIQSADAMGKRFIMSLPTQWYTDYMAILSQKYPDWPVRTRPMPVWVVGLARPDIKTMIGSFWSLDTSATTAPGALTLEGFQFRPLEETLADMADEVITMGAVQKPTGGSCSLM